MFNLEHNYEINCICKALVQFIFLDVATLAYILCSNNKGFDSIFI